jgi:hypothetical protein
MVDARTADRQWRANTDPLLCRLGGNRVAPGGRKGGSGGRSRQARPARWVRPWLLEWAANVAPVLAEASDPAALRRRLTADVRRICDELERAGYP